MRKCVICGNPIEPFISFGKQPLANGFLTPAQFADEYYFELAVCFCSGCKMVQLAEQPEPQQMFNENYAFFSGTSKLMAAHFRDFAEGVRQEYLGNADPFVVEVGSNDGIMLQNFKQWGIRHEGIEPSANVAEVARSRGIDTRVAFFNEDTARAIVAQHGQADAFLGANVMCHIADLHGVIQGIDVLLKPTGVVAFEDPYLGDVIEKTSYDQIYDEHMFLFSGASVASLFGRYGMELIDAIPQETHGGSMRYVIARKGRRSVSPRVAERIGKERALGLEQPETFGRFRRNCERSRDQLVALLRKSRADAKRVVGYAATSKSTTVFNYCDIGPDLVEFISDTTPVKQGKFSPGKHIPVLPYERFKERYPDYALLLAWNHQKEILAKEQDFVARGGKWMTFVPRVEICQ
jgi:methylation protein EvaC